MRRCLTVILFVLTAVLGVVIVIHYASILASAKRSAHWPTVPALILKSELKGPNARGRHWPHIEYRYQVGGRSLEGTRIVFGRAAGLGGADAPLERFPRGSTAMLHVDPSDPTMSVLLAGVTDGSTYVAIACGAVFVFVSGLILYAFKRGWFR